MLDLNSPDMEALYRWAKVYSKHASPTAINDLFENIKVNLSHSSLFKRIVEGKEIFAVPPPRAFSYPWYELMETGNANAYEVHEFKDHREINMLGVEQFPWNIVSRPYKNHWIVSYDYFEYKKEKTSSLWEVFSNGSSGPLQWTVQKR